MVSALGRGSQPKAGAWKNCTWHTGAGWPPRTLAPHGWLTYLDEPQFMQWRWPPAVCSSDRAKAFGALQVLCSPEYQALWELGHQLIGESALTRFASRLRAYTADLRDENNSTITIWYDSIDKRASSWSLQLFISDHYQLWRRLRDHNSPDDWLVDVGGHNGLTALAMRLFAPKANVVTLEPSPWNFLLLQMNLLINTPSWMPKVIALHASLGRREGQAQGIHLPTSTWGSSMEGTVRGGRLGERPKPLLGTWFNTTTTTLPALLRKFSIQQVALLKLDCEGCEWEVTFDWHRRGLWRRIDQLVGELHAFNPTCFEFVLGQRPWRRGMECYPKDLLTRKQAERVYRILCPGRLNPDYVMEGCDDDHLSVIRTVP